MTAVVNLGGGCVIITGGTRGLGKALGLEFSRAGATVFLTHRWGSTTESELRAEFEREGLPAPHVVESDASDADAARALMREVASHPSGLLAIVSNLAFGGIAAAMHDLSRTSFELSLRYSTWPILEYLHAAWDILGYHPRYVLAISTDGGEVCHPGYAMVGVAKAALESLSRYLALHMRSEGVRVNAVRCGPLDTASSRATFGDEVLESGVVKREGLIIDPRAAARACVGLCSGLMDAITGQVITVDEGTSLISPVFYLTDRGWPGPLPSTEGHGAT
jgi:NAD(P)-dependent dehydrogenase (short-subunit alcohol dehydrogenase family)